MIKRFIITCAFIVLVAMVSAVCVHCRHAFASPYDPTFPCGDGSRGEVEGRSLTPDEIQRRAAAVYDAASKALLRVDRGLETGPPLIAGEAAVIVTPSGYALYRGVTRNDKLESKMSFRMADGRRVTGHPLGWSQEWALGLLKLDGTGPWPHVELAESAGVKAGECVVTLGLAGAEKPQVFSRPFLDIQGVAGSAVGRWFVVRDEKTTHWKDTPFCFDLSGKLRGVGWMAYAYGRLGTVYTDANMVRCLWDDLVAGKNLDELRLKAADKASAEKVSPDAPPKESTKAELEENAKAASVRIRTYSKDRGFSGTIVSREGLVATCAHAFAFELPGRKVTVCLADGRDAGAVVVGCNHSCDIALLQITDKGPWPHVEMGYSTRLQPGDAGLYIGYGPREYNDRQPEVRRSTVASPWESHWSPRLEIDPKTPFVGGDSGGGVFDADGRLVAIHGEIGSGGSPHREMRIELIRTHWEELREPYEESATSALDAAGVDHRRAAEAARASLVEVLDKGKPVARGTVVAENGMILTVASVLPEKPTCRLPDGRILPASVIKTSREHNLTVLKIDAKGLKTLAWNKAGNPPPVGTLVALAGRTGFVSYPALPIPPEPGSLWVLVGESPKGLEVTEVQTFLGPSPLRKGDIVVSINDHATPDLKSYQELWQQEAGSLSPSDQARVEVKREGKTLHLRPTLGPQSWPRPEGQSKRYNGFARAYSVFTYPDVTLGEPVLDKTGQVIGVVIAFRARGWPLVVPSSDARDVAVGTE